MKNQISHDSIHRVEPSSKVLAEQRSKVELDIKASQQLAEQQHEEKETITVATESSDNTENESGGNSPRQSHEKTPQATKKHNNRQRPNHYLGGQLFDSEA